MTERAGQGSDEKPASLPSGASEESVMGLLFLPIYHWWMTALEENSKIHGLPVLTRTQVLLVGHISLGEHRAIRLAEKLGVTRQAVHLLIRQLVEFGILELRKDPEDSRALVVDITPLHASHDSAYITIMSALETKLAERFGSSDLEALKRIVRGDWGVPPILTKSDLKRASARLAAETVESGRVIGRRSKK